MTMMLREGRKMTRLRAKERKPKLQGMRCWLPQALIFFNFFSFFFFANTIGENIPKNSIEYIINCAKLIFFCLILN